VPLINVDQLAARLGSADVRIVDTRWYLADVEQGRREYLISHIPGAIFLDVEEDLSTPGTGPGRHPLPRWADFATLLGTRGIGNEHRVIVYDTADGSIAARLWWMLRRLGHEAVSVLDGGWTTWTSTGMPVEHRVNKPSTARFVGRVQSGGSIDRDDLRASLGEVLILDARAPERFEGLAEPVDPIAGHIPTAVSAFHGGNVTADGHFKSPAELRARFAALGVDDGVRTVTYCGSGVTSCHNVLAMHLAGLPEPLLYPGSWSDWSTEKYPVATGPEPGEAPGT
jgi:thiosulfate/3-mercaptopyruvate sulfurtransferase